MHYKSELQRPLTSIVSYPERGEGGNNRYRGNCSPKLIEDLIGFFKPQEICDYMCGSGTTKAAADKAGISSHLYDLHSGFDIMNCEIPERPELADRVNIPLLDSEAHVTYYCICKKKHYKKLNSFFNTL